MKAKRNIYHYREIFKIRIASFKIYGVDCHREEVKTIEKRKENRISEGKKDG